MEPPSECSEVARNYYHWFIEFHEVLSVIVLMQEFAAAFCQVELQPTIGLCNDLQTNFSQNRLDPPLFFLDATSFV